MKGEQTVIVHACGNESSTATVVGSLGPDYLSDGYVVPTALRQRASAGIYVRAASASPRISGFEELQGSQYVRSNDGRLG